MLEITTHNATQTGKNMLKKSNYFILNVLQPNYKYFFTSFYKMICIFSVFINLIVVCFDWTEKISENDSI